MKNLYKADAPEKLDKIATEILTLHPDIRVFTFSGDLGAGKTTLIKSFCKALGVKDQVSSPTFSIVNEYEGHGSIYHIDAYRLKSEHEASDIGLEEYLYNKAYCFIEWPEKIDGMLPTEKVHITIEPDNNKVRIISIQKQ